MRRARDRGQGEEGGSGDQGDEKNTGEAQAIHSSSCTHIMENMTFIVLLNLCRHTSNV